MQCHHRWLPVRPTESDCSRFLLQTRQLFSPQSPLVTILCSTTSNPCSVSHINCFSLEFSKSTPSARTRENAKNCTWRSGSDLIVQLTHRTTAQISRIFIFCIHICNLFIDLLKIFIRNHRLSAQDQLALIWNRKRNIFKNSGIVCDNLPDLTVSACDCLNKRTILGMSVRRSVHPVSRRAALYGLPTKCFQHFYFFCLVKRKHRLLVSLFRKLFEHFITDLSGRTSCQDDPGLFFQCSEAHHTAGHTQNCS